MNNNTGVSVDKNSGSGRNAVIFFALAVVFRSLGMIGRFTGFAGNEYRLFAELILPLGFCALMILCIVLFGKNHFWLSVFPMTAGVLFFSLRCFSADNILAREPGSWLAAAQLCAVLASYVFYSCAVMKLPAFKWVLIPIFILGFVYHLVFEDYPAIAAGGDSLSFSTVMMELSILFVLLGMIFVSFAFRKPGMEAKTAPEKPAADDNGKTPPSEQKKKGFFARLFGKKKQPDSGVHSEENQKNASEAAAVPSQPQSAEVSPVQTQPASEPSASAESFTEAGASKPASTFFAEKDQETYYDPAEDPGLCFDDTYFDTPYTAKLTLDPQQGPAEAADSGKTE